MRDVEYQGPWDATHYELFRAIGGTPVLRDTRFIGHRDRMTGGGHGEWGHAMYVAGTTGGLIERVHARDLWGDGLCLGRTDPRSQDVVHGPPVGLRVRDLTVVRARRNGVSVVAGEDIKLEDVTVVGTHGAPRGPGAGIDLEPDPPAYHPVVGVTVRRAVVDDCQSFGVICDGHPVWGFRMEDSEVRASPGGWALWLRFPEPPAGWDNVVRDCTVYGPCAHLANVRFERCRFVRDRDYAQSPRAVASAHENVEFWRCEGHDR